MNIDYFVLMLNQYAIDGETDILKGFLYDSRGQKHADTIRNTINT